MGYCAWEEQVDKSVIPRSSWIVGSIWLVFMETRENFVLDGPLEWADAPAGVGVGDQQSRYSSHVLNSCSSPARRIPSIAFELVANHHWTTSHQVVALTNNDNVRSEGAFSNPRVSLSINWKLCSTNLISATSTPYAYLPSKPKQVNHFLRNDQNVDRMRGIDVHCLWSNIAKVSWIWYDVTYCGSSTINVSVIAKQMLCASCSHSEKRVWILNRTHHVRSFHLGHELAQQLIVDREWYKTIASHKVILPPCCFIQEVTKNKPNEALPE